MSRGLGKVQREILDNLDTWWSVDIPDQVYDLREVKRRVALLDESRTYGKHRQWCTDAFDVTFHRAVRALVKRGLLEKSRDAPSAAQLRYVQRPKC